MSYEFYRILHLIGIFGVLLSLGGMAIFVSTGGSRSSFGARKLVGMIHGIGLFLVILAGFGLLARLGLTSGMPGWVIAKIVIWLALGGIPTLIYKKPQQAKLWFFAIWILGACAAVLAIIKPF